MEWGFDDEDDGEPMDKDRVRMAAGLISKARSRYAPQACHNGLAISLMIGRRSSACGARTEGTAHK